MSVFVGKGDPIASGLVTFELDESDPRWTVLKEWIVRREVLDIVSTKFSAAEIAKAEWVALESEWHCGYPQPDKLDLGYRAATYDLAHYCERCGTGLRQRAPFRMNGEPAWGRKGILQLNWVFDEYFVTPEVWARAFEPFGGAGGRCWAPTGADSRPSSSWLSNRKSTLRPRDCSRQSAGRAAV